MRFATALLLALVLSSASASSAAPSKGPAPSTKKPQFVSSEDILRWINNYRLKPDPAKLPAAVKAMSEHGVFRDMDAAGIYVGFMAGVLNTNPKRAEDLIAKMYPMPPEDQVAIVRAIAFCDLPDWKDLMLKFAERMPARKALIDRFVYGKQPTLRQMDLDAGTTPLDTLWGFYFATGSREPIIRIISVLAWAKDQNNVERLTIGSMAKLSLATNASRDKELLDTLKSSLNHENKETRIVLQEVVDAAETFEFARVRKDAMAAIDQLKAKGPASARNYQWWGMVGQTALALGWVVGSAMGPVEGGIRCVVGGSLSGCVLMWATSRRAWA